MDIAAYQRDKLDIENVLNDINHNIISSMEMAAFIKNIYCADPFYNYSQVAKAVREYYPHWIEPKVASMIYRLNAILVMTMKNQLSGWVELKDDRLQVNEWIFLAAAQCPIFAENEEFVFKPAYLIRRAIELRQLYTRRSK